MDAGYAVTSISEPKSALNPASFAGVTLSVRVNGVATGAKPVPQASSASDENVRIVPIEEYKEAALSLAKAFETDHVARYFIDTPDRADWTEEQKWDLHLEIMEYMTYAHCLKGLVTTVGPNFGAVALWMPPGQNMDDRLTEFRSGLWRLRYRLSPEGKKRFFTEFMPLLHDTKASVLGPRDDDSWYLVYLGTRPEARGRGYARKLVEDVTRMADVEGCPCYLESSNDVNPKIYAKMGFAIRKKIHLQRTDENVELDIMVREPKARAGSFTEKVSERRTERL
ncbi:hypothetical protein EJ06DRAFT_533908 [Trichodelitschia bisporula]|uniref:N-acetyltransferase domain-containing protein n=1 Tax=Trichodelitschia bisporula TaxID=703511 RepID=A0A6G1HL68_9PEZI|nr:hypothetical protein EJ06DRAFT_533908 [Trichodelitschia bisporula]